jgi:uncharacterized protein RhaS with RHS repeats
VTDQGTGALIYMQARYYDPGVGRFVSEDPGRNGANWYQYCDANPVNKFDPDGKVSMYGLAAAISAFIYLTYQFIKAENPYDFQNDVKYMWGMVTCMLIYNSVNVSSPTITAIRAISQEVSDSAGVPYAGTLVSLVAGYNLTLLFAMDWSSDFEISGK